MSELILRGVLKGHGDMVTAIATTSEHPDMILSSSRDKSIIVWALTSGQGDDIGGPRKRLLGHSHFVQDVVISSDGDYALSASWDNTLRLWDLNQGQTTKLFRGHTGDVMSVAFSADNCQIVSGSRDNSIKVWNTLGECKLTLVDRTGHSDWVNCVRFNPDGTSPVIVSASSDKLIKLYRLHECMPFLTLVGHTNVVEVVTVSPDGMLCASGSKDGTCMLWNLRDGAHLDTLEAVDAVNCLAFSPNHYWLCAGTQGGFKIWDLETKRIVAEVGRGSYPENFGNTVPNLACTAIAFSSDGAQLYTGWSDGHIRSFEC